MKAILEFDLDSIDDRMAHLRCVKSTDMAIILFEINHNLKKKLEHRFEAQPLERTEFDGLDEVFYEIKNLLDEHGVNLDDIIQ